MDYLKSLIIFKGDPDFGKDLVDNPEKNLFLWSLLVYEINLLLFIKKFSFAGKPAFCTRSTYSMNQNRFKIVI